jgi:hypothetical protein
MPPPQKPRPKQPSGAKPMPARPPRERDGAPGGGVPFLQQPFACETFRLCPPPPAPPATVHLRSGRLPTPLIVVSASLLGVTALLLLALLVRWLIRRRHALQDEAPLAREEDDEESVDSTAGWGGEEEVGVVEESGDVHHVWFIRTKGLDERAIAAIAAVVYDSSSAKSNRGGDGGCAVCLAEFRDGETLRLLPRCAHAFHRACIDTWLRAHVNCPLCRAPVQPPAAAAKPNAAPGGEAEEANDRGALAEEAGRSVAQERAVRRAASMVSLPRRAWPPDASSPQAPASSSGREEDVATGLAKVRRLLKFSDMAGVGAGRSFSFGARSCQGLPTTTRSGPSTAAGVNRVIQRLEVEGGVTMN